MRFIVDTNLPPALSEWLINRGHEAVHTTSVGLAAAPDLAIWHYAVQNEAIVVSKDEDFALLKAANPEGPKVIWIRIGNAIRRVLFARLDEAWPAVIEMVNEGHELIEVR
jgi:predicted nuclease of predicted toxin-antitoxin system